MADNNTSNDDTSNDNTPDQEMVKLVIDTEVCVGVGQCELLEPEVFRIDDDDGLSHLLGQGRLPRARAEIVIDRCPSGSLSVERG